MIVCLRSDLGKMSNTQDLMAFSDDPHFFCHFLGGPAADTCIDLIKDQSFCLILVCQQCLDGQHDPGKFSSGYNLLQWQYRLTRVG